MAIGFQRGRFTDGGRLDWTGQALRPMVWTAWYPAQTEGLSPKAQRPKIFREAERYDRAPLTGGNLPLVVLSHGTGGAAEGLSWLAEPLAALGFVVIGIDHHGNTASEPYRAEGFLAWWERARDISVLIDHHLGEGPFAAAIDQSRIYGAGFSMGGYTLLANAGGVTDVQRYYDWAKGSRFAQGPREFPDLHQRFDDLMASSEIFRSAWARQGADYSDARLKAVLALAPAPMVRGFSPESIAAITLPVGLLVGGKDHEAPADLCADWIAPQLAHARLAHLGREAGHYIFMPECTEMGRERMPHLCLDASGVDRAAAHAQALAMALDLFR